MAANPKTFHFTLPAWSGPAPAAPAFRRYPGVEAWWPRCTTAPRQGDGVVRAIVVHATAGSSSSGAVSVMRQAVKPASFHWLVPGEQEVEHGLLHWECVPEERAAWHVKSSASHPEVNSGRKRVNHWSIGIEVVNRQDGKDPFSEWQVRRTAEIIRHAWNRYPTIVDVVAHAKLDPANRTDPGAQFPWETLRELVLEGHGLAAQDELVASKVTVVGPDDQVLPVDTIAHEGVTMVHARPLLESLGFAVEYANGGGRAVMRIRRPRARRAVAGGGR